VGRGARLARAFAVLGKNAKAIRKLPPFGSMLGSQDAGIRGAVFA
jgi:hypothetical protein